MESLISLNYKELCINTIVNIELLIDLRHHNIIPESKKQEIESIAYSTTKASLLYDQLKRGPDKHIPIVIAALRESCNFKAAQILEKANKTVYNLSNNQVAEKMQPDNDHSNEPRKRIKLAGTSKDIQSSTFVYYGNVSNSDNLFRFTKYLGKGSFGFVFQAETNNHGSFAVKLFFPTYPDTVQKKEEQKARALREFDNLKELSHINVVNIKLYEERKFTAEEIDSLEKMISTDDSISTSDPMLDEMSKYSSRAKRLDGIEGICMHMDLCGPNLRSWLNKVPSMEYLPFEIETMRLKIGQQLIDGLKFLHKNKILHRDFKPENIYFSNKFSSDHGGNAEYPLPVKIGDFGLSRTIPEHIERSMTLTVEIGTSLYRAYEVNGERYGEQADLYSLGLVLWEVFQFIPYNKLRHQFNQLVLDKMQNVVNDHPTISNLKSLIIKLTKKDKKERETSIDNVIFNCSG